MASYNSIIVTSAGAELLNSAISSGSKLTFTKAQATQTQYSQEQIKALTGLSPVAQETQNLTVSSADSSQTKVSIIFTNTGLKTGYNANGIGLYVSNGTDETLFAVATAKNAEVVPAYDGTQVQSMVIDFYLALNAENATVNVANAGMVSGTQLADVQSKLSQSVDTVDKNAVHLAGAETISGDKNFTGKLQKGGVDVATKNDNVASSTKLATSRNVGGVAFDGTSDITLPGVNATGNQDTTGLANAVQSLEITNGTDLSTIKGYGGSAVYHIASGITLTSTPSDYSGKGAILKVTESGTTVYQELIDVVTDNGAWIRIIDGSTVNDWQTKGGGRWEMVANGQYTASISKYFTGISTATTTDKNGKGKWHYVGSNSYAYLTASAFDFTKYEYLIIFSGASGIWGNSVINSQVPTLTSFSASDADFNQTFIPKYLNLGGSIGTNWTTTYSLHTNDLQFIIKGVFRRPITGKTPVEAGLFNTDYPFISA